MPITLYNYLFLENARDIPLHLIHPFYPYYSSSISSCALLIYQGSGANNVGSYAAGLITKGYWMLMI